MWGQRKGMCWAQAKYFHMGVEFTGSRWHVGSYVTWRSSRDLLPPYGVSCGVVHSRGTFALQVSCFSTSQISSSETATQRWSAAASKPLTHDTFCVVTLPVKPNEKQLWRCVKSVYFVRMMTTPETYSTSSPFLTVLSLIQTTDGSAWHLPILPVHGQQHQENKGRSKFTTQIKYSAVLWPFISLLHCNCLQIF